LALLNATTRELIEADTRYRETGNVPRTVQIEGLPVCFRRAIRFSDDVASHDVDEVLNAVQQKRDCNQYKAWEQGFSPRDHVEMIREDERRARENERDRVDREWREKQAALEHEWHEKQERWTQRRWLWGFVLILGINIAGEFLKGWIHPPTVYNVYGEWSVAAVDGCPV
jgi:hypothetical protein